MNSINFDKFHGFGNDYIVIEKDELANITDISEFSRRICHRHTGVGGDGIAVLEKSSVAEFDYFCEIVNPDGSIAGFSGNGTRCAVASLYYKNLWTAENLKLKTRSGIKNYKFLGHNENSFRFQAELGKPKFDLPETEFMKSLPPDTEKTISLMFPSEGIVVKVFYVDVGNPVACVFVENFDDAIINSKKVGWRYIGKKVESLTEIFPEKTNVVFIKPLDNENVEIKIWERGAGETSSSGTCSIAAAVASAQMGKTGRKVFVHAEGGTTEAIWREDEEMIITGRADLAFSGTFFG